MFIAFRLAGDRIVGVYILSQLCVVATYWAVFALGRRMLGAAHAAMAILLILMWLLPGLLIGGLLIGMNCRRIRGKPRRAGRSGPVAGRVMTRPGRR